MRQLLPDPQADVDPAVLHAALRRPAPADRPWVALNMVTSIDGATQVDGLSGGLGGPADKQIFAALRAVADVILVAAGTVRAEHYGPPRSSPARRAERRARGQTDAPRPAIVSGSLDLDLDGALFTEATDTPLVITSRGADPAKVAEVSQVAEVVAAGDGRRVDLGEALRHLRTRGIEVVLAEGGPSLNGQLLSAGVIDELNLSVSPVLTGPGMKGLTTGPPPAAPVTQQLSHALTEDGFLFLRYVAS